jgi:ferredoxin
VPWSAQVELHISIEGTRVELQGLLNDYCPGDHLYTCGPDRYMDAVITGAQQLGWPEESLHREYFSAPEAPEYKNHPFSIMLQRSGRRVEVSAEQDAARALIEAGVHVNLKCSDGICGVCKCQVLSGDVEHRDFVLSAAQRREAMILCQSRAAQAGGEIVLDL